MEFLNAEGEVSIRIKKAMKAVRASNTDLHGFSPAGTYPSVHALFSVKFGFSRRRKIHLVSEKWQ